MTKRDKIFILHLVMGISLLIAGLLVGFLV